MLPNSKMVNGMKKKSLSVQTSLFVLFFFFKKVPRSIMWHIYLRPIHLSLSHRATREAGEVFILSSDFPAKDSISVKEKMDIGGQLAAVDIIAAPLDLWRAIIWTKGFYLLFVTSRSNVEVTGKGHLGHYKGELSNSWNISTMDDLTYCSGELILSGGYSSSRLEER